MKFIKILVAFLMIFELSASAKISEENVAKDLEKLISQSQKAFTSSKNIQEGAKKIYAILDPVFDFALMARLSFGSKQCKQLDKEQRKAFMKEFEQKLKDAFVDKLQYYTDQEFKIGEVKNIKNRKIVPVWVVGKKKTYQIDYKFYDAKERGWLIYDVVIIGVDVIQTYRNQFNGILKHKSFDEVLKMLRSTNIAPDEMK